MISIIIPVYNVEDYLEDCIKSFIEQLTPNDEVILVEDCSTDSSPLICSSLANKNPQISIIKHPHNKGLSEARNSGIFAAKEEYITFIDSDDFLAPNTLTQNLQILRDNPSIDILEYPVSVHYYSDQNYTYSPGENKTETYAEWIKREGYRHSFACNKIFKKKLWTEGRKFPPGKYFEDLYTIPYIMEKASIIYASNHGQYFYCQRKKSICSSAGLAFHMDHIEASANLFTKIKTKNILNKQELDIMYCQICDPQIMFYINGGTANKLPRHKISFSSIFSANTIILKFKTLLLWMLESKYCCTFAKIRKTLINKG